MLVGNNTFSIFLSNSTGQKKDVKYEVYTLTNSANEMKSLATVIEQKNYFVEAAKELKTKYNGALGVALHKVDWVAGTRFGYDKNDLLVTEGEL